MLVNNINKKRNLLELKKNTVKDISPLSILNKGYSIVYTNGKVTNKISNFKIDKEIKIRVKDGEVISKINKINLLDH